MTFLDVARAGGESAYLAPWLLGEYHAALETSGVTESAMRDTSRTSRHTRSTRVGVRVDARKLADVVLSAAQQVMGVLAAFHARGASAVADLVDSDLVEAVRDEDGNLAYCPRSHPRMRLEDRVLGLLFAELLTRPHEVLRDLVVEGRCVSLASAPEDAPSSGIRPRETMPWTPETDRSARAAWPILVRAPSLAELAAQL